MWMSVFVSRFRWQLRGFPSILHGAWPAETMWKNAAGKMGLENKIKIARVARVDEGVGPATALLYA